ncbi:hypothetical protein [Persicobacter diffluens]|uniref:Lipoprotein n=1 Tax=Persicobacter diffluens TaxID=981 RepID=A0AAN4VYU6_9BACT|nr:lipoprotein [Persicobacter diffluens]
MRSSSFFALLFILGLTSCATYYQINQKFNAEFESGKISQAEKTLSSDKKGEEGRNRFLYLVNMGVVNSLMGNYDLSNDYFEKAYVFGEDFKKNYGQEALAMVSNPMVTTYPGEDHEHLLLLYYKALNYLMMGDTEKALVECRRLDIRQYALSDKYKSEAKYRKDAFVHTLMGICYDADRDYNNAFIAYRNAYEIFKNDYKKLFNLEAPYQLKEDLIRTALLSGFPDEADQYRKAFNIDYQLPKNYRKQQGELVFFWNNGLGPVKAEWSVNFTLGNNAGMVTFANQDLGMNFAFPYSPGKEGNDLSNLQFVRVAFPKYVERPAAFQGAQLVGNGETYPLNKVEDVNAIAFKTLQERMLLEFSKSLLRVAIKKSAEYAVRQENENAGFAVGILNALTEKADTRNWQTIPHTIYYSRVPLNEGVNEFDLNIQSSVGPQMNQKHHFKFEGSPRKTVFQTFYSLEIDPRWKMPYY